MDFRKTLSGRTDIISYLGLWENLQPTRGPYLSDVKAVRNS
jgi:hypothetical protein